MQNTSKLTPWLGAIAAVACLLDAALANGDDDVAALLRSYGP
ncbi:MAG: hypothetical protein AAF545_06125 [Pseudomonadota bacterium]